MWACRSFLMSQRRTLLNSIRRRVTEPPTVVLGATSRWLVSDTSDSDRRNDDANDKAAVSTTARRHGGEPAGTPATTRNAPAPADRSPPMATGVKKHLYLLLADAEYGFGIHKLDMDSNRGDDVTAGGSVDSGAALPGLPNPPMLRIEDMWIDTFAVLGSDVIGMSSGLRNSYDSRSYGDTLTFDAKTAQLALLPDLPDGVRNNRVVLAVAAGENKLLVIKDGTVCRHRPDYYDHDFCRGGLHCLIKLKNDDEAATELSHGYPKQDHPVWYWHVSNCNGYLSTRWFWSCNPRKLPLSPEGITAHAMDAAGHAFFVLVHYYRLDDLRGRGTFSYDTEHGYWTRHGDWELPFIGQAHYDQGLRAWVGIHAQRDGHICACDVPGLDRTAAPDWKLSKEKLFLEDPERHVDAKLVDMGGGGRFCLVEIVTMPGVDSQKWYGDGDNCVLRLTAFRVEYDDNGESSPPPIAGLRARSECPTIRIIG